MASALGKLNRLQRRQSGGEEPFRDNDGSLAIAGAPGDVGIIFNFYARPEKGQRRRYGVAGHSFASIVEFGSQEVAQPVRLFLPEKVRQQRTAVRHLRLFQQVTPAEETVGSNILRGLSMRDYKLVLQQFMDAYGLEKSTISERFLEASSNTSCVWLTPRLIWRTPGKRCTDYRCAERTEPECGGQSQSAACLPAAL